MSTRTMALLVLAAACAATPARGQTAAAGEDVEDARRVRAVRMERAPRVDGRMDPGEWDAVPAAGGFVQRQPEPGAAATQPTSARVAYDGDALFVLLRMEDAHPDSIAAPLARRDAVVPSDWAAVMLDGYDDNRTGFLFAVNPRGVRRDAFLYEDVREDPSWDGAWEAAAAVDDGGWTAEFRIPLSQLRFTAGGGAWGVNFQRVLARRGETSYWSPTPPNAGAVVSRFGVLEGVDALSAPRRLELLPYTAARLTRAPAAPGDPFHGGAEPGAAVGLDVRYGLPNDLAFTATLNPDFGQVEADPSQVNLAATELFLPERRPFFLEAADLFSFGLGMGTLGGNEQLFYSRRVGRAPQRPAGAPGAFVDAPVSTRVLGAAKLSGTTRSGWSVGILDAVTAGEEARVSLAGADTVLPVEPLSNYAVLRATRRLRQGRSALGAIVTSTHRDAGDPGLAFLRSAAYAGGADGRHRFGGGRYEVSGSVLGSHVRGAPLAMLLTQTSAARRFQRPDASHLRVDSAAVSMSGMAANLEVAKIGGGHWVWRTAFNARSPGFEVNDLGYQRNADLASQVGAVGYVQYRPSRLLRTWNVFVQDAVAWTFGGERILGAAVLQGSAVLQSQWTGSGSVTRFFPALSVDALWGGPALRTPARTLATATVSSDPRRRVSGQLTGTMMAEEGTSGSLRSITPALTFRPSPRAELSAAPTLARLRDDWQFIRGVRALDGQPHWLVGRLSQTTAALTLRLGYAFTPSLTLQAYAQPFVSGGEFRGIRRVTAPRAGTDAGRFAALDAPALVYDGARRMYAADLDGDGAANLAFPQPDFTLREVRSNAVLRWEYRPGSVLYAVWQQGRSQYLPEGGVGFGESFASLLEQPATHVLMVKASFWIGS